MHARMTVQQRAGGARGRAQPGVEAGRMQPARRLDHYPAMVAVRADLLALALARHDTDALGTLAERCDLASQDLVLPGVAGEREAAAALVFCRQPLARDQLLQDLERGARPVPERRRPARSVTPGEVLP